MASPLSNCRCGGSGWLIADARYGEPDFGKLIPCVCKDAERKQRAELKRQQFGEKLGQDLGILAGCTLENFELARPLTELFDGDLVYTQAAQLEVLEAALAVARAYVADPDGWLFLHGPPGAGKSHLAAAVGRALVERGWSVLYGSTPRILQRIRQGFGSDADEVRAGLLGVKCLVVDDLGAEHTSGWASETLYDLLNERHSAGRATVITSNHDLAGLGARDNRIASRIAGASTVIHLAVSDYRRVVQMRRRNAR